MKMDKVFLGLAVKRETPDDVIDAAPLRSSAMQWSFPNKPSAHPRLFSFRGSQEDRPKTGFDSLASTGLVTITTTAVVDSDIHKSYSGMMQKNAVHENHGGVRYTVTTYPTKNLDAQGVHHHSFVSGQDMIGSVSPQLSGVQTMNPVPAMPPSNSPVVGTTNLRDSSRTPVGPSQLTIFYNGSVCVYDNISHEKAQAIMLLAGNAPPPSKAVPAAPVQAVNRPPMASPVPVQAPTPMPTVLESFVVNQPYGTTQRLSSPPLIKTMSVSHPAGRSGTFSEMTASKPGGVLVSYSRPEPVKVANSSSADTVPQFRRKSLARFLEKRKERVIHASPYANKESPDCSTPGAGSTSLSMNSSGSCPVLHVN